MEENIYKAPDANLLDNEAEQNQDLYVVSPLKFSLLYILTMGLYSIYWFYKNWKLVKIKEGSSIIPVMRGIFQIFFVHSLFRRVDALLKEKSIEFQWSPAGLATMFVLLSVFSAIADRLSSREIASPFTDFVSIILVPILMLILLKAQKAINSSQDDPQGTTNAQFSAANYIWMLLGAILWLFLLIGILAITGALDVGAI